MKKLFSFTFSILFLCFFHSSILAQISVDDQSETDGYYKPSINIFTLRTSGDNSSALISLSEIYQYHLDSDAPFYEQDGSLIIPNMTAGGFKEVQYTLTSTYRERFLSHTGISETDFVFIYDYQVNRLVILAVKNLNVIARLNDYSSPSNAPFHHYDYLIGFEIDTRMLNHLEEFVYVGAKNPFALEQLTPLTWKKIAPQKFPATTQAQDEKFYSNYPWDVNLSSKGGNTYSFEANGFEYFLQDYLSNGEVNVRRLLIIEAQTQAIITDKIFYESESSSLTPLKGADGAYNETFETPSQWTGKLFKNKPPVFFGFEWISFGCPAISIIDKSNEDIVIYCDSRH